MGIFAHFWRFYASLHLCLGSPLNSQQLIVSGSPLTPQQLILSVRFPFNTPTADSVRFPPVLSGKAPCETCSQTESSLQCHPTGQSECRKSQLPFLPAPVFLWWRWLDRWFLKAHKRWLERWLLKAHKWWLERWLLKVHKRWLERWLLKAHKRWLERWLLKAHKRWLERWLLKAHK